MIFVTVGTEKYPFDRLMHWIDALSLQGILQEDQEEIVVQYGSCRVVPTGAKVYKLLPEQRFQSMLKSARLVIAHCGEGSFSLLDTLTVPYILVPRSSRYREHVDDHQVELALAMEERGVPIAWSPGDLASFIASPYRVAIPKTPTEYLVGLCHQLEQRFGAGAVPQASPIPSLFNSI